MWRNYLVVALRALAKNRTYAVINILGLAIGLAACLMILLYVRYEQGYERWMAGAENVYQLQSHFRDPATGDEGDLQMAPYPAGPALAQDFPEIEARIYMGSARPVAMRGAEALTVENAHAVDGPLFDVLPLPLLAGDPARALAEIRSAVLSESEALRLFGGSDIVGRTLTIVERGEHVDYRVTGILADLPRQSHLRINMLLRVDPAVYFGSPNFTTSWGQISGWVYLRLAPGADIGRIHAAMPGWERRNIPPITVGNQVIDPGENQEWRLMNVRDVHLGEAQDGAMTPGNDRRTIVTFAIIALLILGMACVNFTNLATARAGQRAREVALRKVLGASRRQLVTQFLAESLIVAAFAMLLALALAELSLPLLSRFLDADLAMTYFGGEGLLLPILLLVLLVGAAGGAYPALYLSRFQPAAVLKANKSAAETEGSGRLRSLLVVGQFAVSIGLIICTAIVYAQTLHARTADPGYQRDGLIQIGQMSRQQIAPQSGALAREIARVEGVRGAARTNMGVNTTNQYGTTVYAPGQQPLNIGHYRVDAAFFPVMGIDLVAGRLLDPDRPMDDSSQSFDPAQASETGRALVARGVNVVLNRTAARRMGFADPAQAVGRTVQAALVDPAAGLVPVTIVGVVEDSRFRSIRTPIEPMLYRLTEDWHTHLVARYEGDPAAVRDRIAAVWSRFASDVPFEAEYSEDIVAELYGAETARAQTFAGFALLAIIVACLGLFGLAAFTAERRTREIGIRKVLGARSRDIVRLLAWQFSKPVIVANLIAWPIAWWAMRDWLNGFDTRITLGPGPFLLAALLALAIAIGTIAGHALRVARANPINALRYE